MRKVSEHPDSPGTMAHDSLVTPHGDQAQNPHETSVGRITPRSVLVVVARYS
jgi:hypothetical protein